MTVVHHLEAFLADELDSATKTTAAQLAWLGLITCLLGLNAAIDARRKLVVPRQLIGYVEPQRLVGHKNMTVRGWPVVVSTGGNVSVFTAIFVVWHH